MPSSGIGHDVRPLRAVIIDDDPDMRAMLGESLELAGWRVEVFARAEEALFAIAARVPDAVMTDMALGPGVSGLDLARRLRSEPSIARTVIVAISGCIAPSQLVLRPFDAFLLKPLELAALDPLLRALVDERVAARQA